MLCNKKKGDRDLPVAVPAYVLIACFFVISAVFGSCISHSQRHVQKEPEYKKIDTSGVKINPLPNKINELEDDEGIYIEVNIAATELRLMENGQELFSRRVAIGSRRHKTPEHADEIQVIEWNPWWYPPKAEWAKKDKPTPPGPRNPLGPVKLRIGKYGEILFHGTNNSWSVGRPVSHGCMRMKNDEAKGLAWYLQRKLSSRDDPNLLEKYKARGKKTFRVSLDDPVKVKLIYRPVEVRNTNLILYPDHYGKMKNNKKAEVLLALFEGGIGLEYLDDQKIEAIVRRWPTSKKEVPLEDLLIVSPDSNLLNAPECS